MKERAQNLPGHVAIIMDGNGRWARLAGNNRVYGHLHGAKRAIEIIKHAASLSIPRLTLFALSQENLSRPADEVDAILRIFGDSLENERETLEASDVCLRFIGDHAFVRPGLKTLMAEMERLSSGNTGTIVNIALNYSGRWHICQASEWLRENTRQGEEVTAEMFEQAMSACLAHPVPDVDLLIRTGNEFRISNFTLWQAAYSELYFTKTAWPDFSSKDFDLALQAYSKRDRRFGLIDHVE